MAPTQLSDPSTKIVFAGIADVPEILMFIRELAKFEKLESEVEATEEKIRTSLFGQRPSAEVIFIDHDGERAGFAIFFGSYSTFLGQPGLYLEDLYVRPTFRSRGLGQYLLAFLARLAEERGCGRLEWSVLDWNTRAAKFYASLGARSLNEWTTYRLSKDELRKLATSPQAVMTEKE